MLDKLMIQTNLYLYMYIVYIFVYILSCNEMVVHWSSEKLQFVYTSILLYIYMHAEQGKLRWAFLNKNMPSKLAHVYLHFPKRKHKYINMKINTICIHNVNNNKVYQSLYGMHTNSSMLTFT